jgi:hypothetical protein
VEWFREPTKDLSPENFGPDHDFGWLSPDYNKEKEMQALTPRIVKKV